MTAGGLPSIVDWRVKNMFKIMLEPRVGYLGSVFLSVVEVLTVVPEASRETQLADSDGA